MDLILNFLKMFVTASGYLNPVINRWVPILILVFVALADVIWLFRWILREGADKGLISFSSLVLIEATIVSIIVVLPKLLILLLVLFILALRHVVVHIPEGLIRWIILYAGSAFIYLYTREHGDRRGVYSYLAHLTLILIGWLAGKWSGILFISLPVLVVYYLGLYFTSQAVIPASDADSPGLHYKDLPGLKKAWNSFRHPAAGSPNSIRNFFRFLPTLITATELVAGEKWQRFLVLVWYSWGLQYPLLIVTDPFGREHETRINGNLFRSIGRPGLIKAQSHHAVGITTGVRFARVDGPGTVFFSRKFERLFEVVDLRTQLRTNTIEAISKDGNPFQAVLFAAFAIDRQNWSLADYHRLKIVNPILREGRALEHKDTSFPFSPARIRAALSTTGVTQEPQNAETAAVHWDARVMSLLEEAARFVLAQRNLDELWRPRNDARGASALNEISAEIISLTRNRLQERGVNLFSARVVNFIIKPDDHPIIKQQIQTWRSLWQQRAAQTKARGSAEAGRLQQEAKAFARSILLTSLAEGIRKTNISRPDLARNIIALRFIGALEEMVQQQPSETREEYLARMDKVRQQILLSRMKS